MRDRDNAKEGKDFVWVDMKDSKGNIVKDGKGNAVKTRKFGVKAEAPAASPKPKAKPAAAPAAKKSVSATASAAPTKSIRPKAKTTAAPKPTTDLTDSQRSSLNMVGRPPRSVLKAETQGNYMTTNTKPKPKYESPVPGRAIVMAIKNAFTGKGETDAAKITSRKKKP